MKEELGIPTDSPLDTRVSVVNVSDPFNKNEVTSATERAIDMIGGMNSFVSRGDVVLIKPNLVVPRTSYSGITTDLTVLKEVISEVKGEKGRPVIGESSSIGFDQDLTFFILGIRRLASKMGAAVVNFDKTKLEEFEVPNGIVLKKIRLPQILREADAIINIPKMKTHELTGITVGLRTSLAIYQETRNNWPIFSTSTKH